MGELTFSTGGTQGTGEKRILVTVKGRKASAAYNDIITSGSRGIDAAFSFDDEWNGLQKIAVFCAGERKINRELTEDACRVPAEVMAVPLTYLQIGLYGVDGTGNIVIPTVYASVCRIEQGTDPNGEVPEEEEKTLIETLLDASEDAKRIAQSVRDDADRGAFNGKNGASAYQVAVANGYEGTEAEWLASLHGQDATVDATLTQAGEAADAAATGEGIAAAQHSAAYAKLYAETLNSGAGIPLDTEWSLGGLGNGGSVDRRAYRVHTEGLLQFTAGAVLQAATGYRFYVQTYSANGTVTGTSEWYGPAYTSRKTYTVEAGALLRIVAGAAPEDGSVTADPSVIGQQITIVNNIGSGGTDGTTDYAALGNKPKIGGVELSGNKTPAQLGLVAAEQGKGLSANDYTTEDKTKLAGIETGAQKNPDLSDYATKTWVEENGYLTQHQSLAAYRTEAAQDQIDQQLADAIPTKTSDLKNDSGYLTQHQDISGKADKVVEITVAGGGAVTQAVEPGKVYHVAGSLTALTITAEEPGAGHYHLDFVSGSTAPTVTLPGAWIMPSGFAVEANMRYEIDVLDCYGVAQCWEVTA